MIKAVVFDLDDTLISEKEYVLSGFKTVSKDISFKYNLNFEKVYEKMIVLFNESSQRVFDRILESFEYESKMETLGKIAKAMIERGSNVNIENLMNELDREKKDEEIIG